MAVNASRSFVLVHDPELALAFYRDALGLELRNDVAREEFRWLTVGAPSQPDFDVVLTNYLSGSPADSEALAALLAKGLLPGLVLSTNDVDAEFARLEAAGCDVIQEPVSQHWGRDCAFRDPAGNMVRINQH
jgi:predicted enzyme related to lactoylglutathione lyase